MIKKILIGIVTAGMILITIPTVNAEDEITLNEVTDQIIDISDKYNSCLSWYYIGTIIEFNYTNSNG